MSYYYTMTKCKECAIELVSRSYSKAQWAYQRLWDDGQFFNNLRTKKKPEDYLMTEEDIEAYVNDIQVANKEIIDVLKNADEEIKEHILEEFFYEDMDLDDFHISDFLESKVCWIR